MIITTEDKKVVVYDDVEELIADSNGDITLEKLLSKRTHSKSQDGWVTYQIKDSDNLWLHYKQISEMIFDNVDMQKRTFNLLLRGFKNVPFSNRIMWEENINKFDYCAGQDHKAEINTIRRAIKRA